MGAQRCLWFHDYYIELVGYIELELPWSNLSRRISIDNQATSNPAPEIVTNKYKK